MGNLVQCCHTISSYIKRKDATAEGGAERSPLLSTEGSECDSSTLPDDLEDDLLTASAPATNPTLEPEHFLFPDIILSSGMGGDAVLVEPMVCLLVSEEEEEEEEEGAGGGFGGMARRDEVGEEGQERGDGGRKRLYTEVETQTEAETHLGTGVQTQTESQAEVHTQTETHTKTKFETEMTAKMETQSERDALGLGKHDKAEQVELKENCVHNEPTTTFTEHNTITTQAFLIEQNIVLMKEVITDEEKNTKAGSIFQLYPNTVEMDRTPAQKDTQFQWTEHSTLQTRENVEETKQNTGRTVRTSVMLTEQNVGTTEQDTVPTEQDTVPTEQDTIESQQTVYLTKRSVDTIQLQTVENSDPYARQTQSITLQTKQNAEQMGQRTSPSCQKVNENEQSNTCTKLKINLSADETDQSIAQSEQNVSQTDQNIIHTEETLGQAQRNTVQVEGSSNESEQNVDHTSQNTVSMGQNQIKADLCPVKMEEKENKTGPQHDVVLEREGRPEMKQVTLFLVDRLFLTAPHAKVPPKKSGEGSMKDGPEQSHTDKGEELSIQEVVNLHEMGFIIRIQAPGTETFELQVSSQMLVAELHQVLMDHELTCHRTCFSLQLGGAALDNLTELRSIQGIQEGVLIKVVEDSYTVRDARLHLRHVRDLLRSLDPTDAHNGVNGSSLSYLSLYTQGETDSESVGKRRASEKEPVDYSPPEYILPGCKDRPLTPLQPMRDDWKPLQCLRVLTMSSWNPPPGNRKMHGDLMYLNTITMEDRNLNITASTRGFYLNQSTAFTFNPKPAVPKILCHSLVELLSQVSPAFRKNFSALQKKRVLRHPYERIATPYQVYTWTAPHGDHALDCVRAEETHTSRMGQDEHTAGQSRDWNEELQGCRELPRRNLQERLNRERNIFKTNSDFVGAATRGAIAVVDGNVMAINPGEEPRMQMFIWNNLFFSLGFDTSDHYRPLGGNAAAHAAAVCDLRGVQAYASVDTEGLHTLGTAVVDYRSYRVIAQTIVPGILEKNQEQNVVYGSNDYGKTVLTHPRFVELLNKTSEPLRIHRHQVLDHNHSPVELCSCVETKGILGNDGRPYILDLLRTFPPDLNFLFSEKEAGVAKECKSFGYPRRHRHSLSSLRPELIEAFVQHRYEVFLSVVSTGLSKLETGPESQEKVGDSAGTSQDEDMEQKAMETVVGATSAANMDSQRRQVIANACKAVGSVSDSRFDIRFNPDVCSSGVRVPPECAEEVQKHKELLWDAASFLRSNQIPAALRDCLDQTAVPMDGATLASALHQRGVNVRYLGSLLELLEKVEEKERLSHIQRIAISELIIRSAKHIFRIYLQDVEPAAFSAAVSHFLNCLLSSSSSFPDSASDELLSRRRSRRRRSHGSRVAMVAESVWARLTPSDLWAKIRNEAEDYYHHTLHSQTIDDAIEKYNLQKISLLREIAIKTGIQVQLREYVFESRHRPIFGEEDVVNMFPVVKHLNPTASQATRLLHHAQVAVQQGLLKDGYELISQALTLFSSVCGVLHDDVCMCLRLLGRLSYILGEYADALSHQEKAVMSSERVQGIDHPQTIQDYTYLALYCFAGGQHTTSLRLLYRARYLSLLVSGEDHPQFVLLDSMLGLVLHGLMEYELSLKFLNNALNLTSKYHGATSLKQAHSHHLLATVNESKGEFRLALQHEKEAYSIYKSQVGENHDSTKESSEYLKSLTQQAVILQKALNHIYSNTASACIPPPKFSTPSLPMILQQLNLTCGIILIPLSAKEIADLRTELKGKEKAQVQELENQLKLKDSRSASD
ncbi:clustered mitochondria protein homolog [Polymixia lowei]